MDNIKGDIYLGKIQNAKISVSPTDIMPEKPEVFNLIEIKGEETGNLSYYEVTVEVDAAAFKILKKLEEDIGLLNEYRNLEIQKKEIEERLSEISTKVKYF